MLNDARSSVVFPIVEILQNIQTSPTIQSPKGDRAAIHRHPPLDDSVRTTTPRLSNAHTMNITELETKTVGELRDIARDRDLSGYTALRKQELIFWLL